MLEGYTLLVCLTLVPVTIYHMEKNCAIHLSAKISTVSLFHGIVFTLVLFIQFSYIGIIQRAEAPKRK